MPRNTLMVLALTAAATLFSACSDDEGTCDVPCTLDDDCGREECCVLGCCRSMDCADFECGPDLVCGKNCGICGGYVECLEHRCEGDPICNPGCPEGSECRDLDGVLGPECVWPSGELACIDDRHCPPQVEDGSCGADNTCSYTVCSCATDSECPEDRVCITFRQDCGSCWNAGEFSCQTDDDCVVAAVVDCCTMPLAYNVTAVEEDPCLLEYPFTETPPSGCIIDCYFDHCWPLRQEPFTALCIDDACRIDPPPFDY